MRLHVTFFVALAVVACSARVSYGESFLILLLDDLSNTKIDVIIQDGSGKGEPTPLWSGTEFLETTNADADPEPGQIGLVTDLDTGNFYIKKYATLAFGLGGGPDTLIDLQLGAKSKSFGSLVAKLIWTGVTVDGVPASLFGSIGGSGGETDFAVGFDAANGISPLTVIEKKGLIGDFGFQQTVGVTGSNPFSLSIETTLHSTAADDAFNFNASGDVGAVPEPSSWVIWTVIAGLGICLARWRARKQDTAQDVLRAFV